MAKRLLNFESIKADYICPECEKKIEGVSIFESIYNGAPICPKCTPEMEMDIIEVYEIEETPDEIFTTTITDPKVFERKIPALIISKNGLNMEDDFDKMTMEELVEAVLFLDSINRDDAIFINARTSHINAVSGGKHLTYKENYKELRDVIIKKQFPDILEIYDAFPKKQGGMKHAMKVAHENRKNKYAKRKRDKKTRNGEASNSKK